MDIVFNQKLTYSKYIKYLLPSILSMIFVSFYTTIDGFFVSHYVSSNALAAINIIVPLTALSFGIAIMMATGSGALIGIRLGKGDHQYANRNFSFIFTCLIVISIIMTVLGVIFIDDILILLGSTETLLAYTYPYGLLTVIMTPFMMIKLFLESYARVDGSPKIAMTMSIVGLILNIILDYIFIVHMNLGIVGAGLGTMLSIVVSALIGIWHFTLGKSNLRFTKFKMNFKLLVKSCFNGSSEMLTELSTGITTLIFNYALLRYAGENGVAAMAIITYLYYFFIAVFFGIAVGSAPMISYKLGASKHDEIKSITKAGYFTIIISSILIFVLIQLFSTPIVSIFTDNIQVIALGTHGLKLFSYCFLLIGINIFASGYFTALGNGLISAIISSSRALIFIIPVLALFTSLFGLDGVWLTVPMAEFITIFISLFFHINRRKKLI